MWALPGPDPRVGDLLFADATRVWEVANGYVKTFDFGDDLAAVGYRHTRNGVYSHTTVTARSARCGMRSWSIADPVQAQRFLDFLVALRQFMRSRDESHSAIMAAGPGEVARAAVLMLEGSSRPGGLPPVVQPPEPLPPAVQRATGKGGGVVLSIQAMLIAAAAAIGLWKGCESLRDDRLFAAALAAPRGSFEPIDQYLEEYPAGRHAAEAGDLRDDMMFALVSSPPRGASGELPPIDRYLKEYPQGRHAKETVALREDWYLAAAREEPEGTDHLNRLEDYLSEYPHGRYAAEVSSLRDDQVFSIARKQSEASASPGGLRKYLADRRNARHRQEANRLISGYYERAAADLRARAQKLKTQAEKEKGAEPIDPQLIQSLIALVESLKGVDDPVLSVGFVPEIEPEPRSAEAKAGEDASYKYHLNNGMHTDEVRRLEQQNPGKTALIPHANTFDTAYLRSREDMIFRRFSEAIEHGIRSDILTLRRAAPGELPNIEIRYRIYAAGYVIPFNEVKEDNSYKRTLGLLRMYSIDWTMTFRAPGGGAPTVYRTETRPGSNLLYRMEPGDPDWAIYAVNLYSAFYGLSDKMSRALGQDPGRMPDAFTWKGTSSFRGPGERPMNGSPKVDPSPPPKRNFD